MGKKNKDKPANANDNRGLQTSVNDASLYDDNSGLMWFLDGLPVDAGVHVSERSVLAMTIVGSCIRRIANTVASLPLHIYQRTDKGSTIAHNHPMAFIIGCEPNVDMSKVVFFETILSHAVGWGNGYAYIDRSGSQIELLPMLPDRTRAIRENGNIIYLTRINGQFCKLRSDEVIHIQGETFNGIQGVSPIQKYRQSLGLSIAVEKMGARYFGSGMNPSGVLTVAKELGDKARLRLRESLTNAYSGVSKAQRVLLLEEGMDWKQTSINPNDSQFIETRNLQTVEVCRIYDVPPNMVYAPGKNVYDGTNEDVPINFVKFTLRSWLGKIEHELNRKLLLESEKSLYYCKFDLNDLERGNKKNRYEAYAIGKNGGWLKTNDILQLEDMEIVDGQAGEMYWRPTAVTDANAPIPVQPTGGAVQLPANSASWSAVPMAAMPVKASTIPPEAPEPVPAPVGRDDDEEGEGEESSLTQILTQRAGLDDVFQPLVAACLTRCNASSTAADMTAAAGATIHAMARAVSNQIARELGNDPKHTDDVKGFVDKYVNGFAQRHSGKDQPTDVKAVASRECRRLRGAVTREAYREHGVKSVRYHSDKCSNPICNALHDRTVGTNDPFALKGDNINGNDVTYNVYHGPMDQNCRGEILANKQ